MGICLDTGTCLILSLILKSVFSFFYRFVRNIFKMCWKFKPNKIMSNSMEIESDAARNFQVGSKHNWVIYFMQSRC